jgi:serine protease Do
MEPDAYALRQLAHRAIQSVTDDIADSFGLDRARGVLVANVTADGPAAKAGLKRNDIIVSFGGQDVLDLRRFPKIVANARVGSTVDVVVWRGAKEVPLKLRVGEQEEAEKQNTSAQGAKKPSPPDQPVTSTIEQLGLTLQKVTDQLRERYGLSDQVKGVIVTSGKPVFIVGADIIPRTTIKAVHELRAQVS